MRFRSKEPPYLGVIRTGARGRYKGQGVWYVMSALSLVHLVFSVCSMSESLEKSWPAEPKVSANRVLLTTGLWSFFGCTLIGVPFILWNALPVKWAAALSMGNVMLLLTLAGSAPEWTPHFVGDVDYYASLLVFPTMFHVILAGPYSFGLFFVAIVLTASFYSPTVRLIRKSRALHPVDLHCHSMRFERMARRCRTTLQNATGYHHSWSAIEVRTVHVLGEHCGER